MPVQAPYLIHPRIMILGLIVYCISNATVALSQQQVIFRHFTKRENLSANQVFNVIKDKQGYIWFATGNGLQRFDGVRWKTWQHNRSATGGLPDNRVTHLLEDRMGRFWIGTAAGICLLDRHNFTFKKIQSAGNGGPGHFTLQSLMQTSEGRIWYATKSGNLFVLNEAQMKFEPYTTVLPGIKSRITSIAYDSLRHYYWIATDSGLKAFDTKHRRYYHGGYNPNNISLFHVARVCTSPIVALHINSKNELWCSAWIDHFGYSLNTNEVFFTDTTSAINGIRNYITTHDGVTWGSGLNLVKADARKGKLERIMRQPDTKYGIDFYESGPLFEDDENNIWLPSDNGVFTFNPPAQFVYHQKIATYHSNKKESLSVTGFVELRDGRTVMLAWGHDGIYFFDENMQQVQPPARINRRITDTSAVLAWCGLQSTSGEVWIGCQRGELIRIDLEKKRADLIKDPAFDDKTIGSIVEDKDGNIWFGGRRQNIVKWNRRTGAYQIIQSSQTQGEADGMIRRLLYDGNKHIWAAVAGAGIVKINTHTGSIEKRYRFAGGISTANVHDIIKISDELLLFATDGGLIIMNVVSERTETLTTTEGLPHNEVLSLTAVSAELAYFTTPNGIAQLHLPTRRITELTLTDGVEDVLFIPASILRKSDGKVLLGTNRGFATLFHDKANRPQKIPNLAITGIKVFDKYLSADSILGGKNELSLGYHENYLTIEFSSMSVQTMGKIEYLYKLEGIEDSWRKADKTQQATYTYLPGGHYRFLVKAVFKDGGSGEKLISLPIRVVPPFWQTWWFYLLALLAVALAAYWLARLKQRRREEGEKVRSRIARDLHDDMGSTLSTINILSEMAKKTVEKDITATKEFIRQISRNSSQMMESMDDIVWSIDPSNDSMDSVISRMREFAGNLLEASGINCTFREDENVKYINLPLGERHDFFMIFKEAVNNLAKYSSCTSAEISLYVQNGALHMLIKDNGSGFDKALVNDGNGLVNMQHRARALGGVITIDTGPGEGTAILLKLKS